MGERKIRGQCSAKLFHRYQGPTETFLNPIDFEICAKPEQKDSQSSGELREKLRLTFVMRE